MTRRHALQDLITLPPILAAVLSRLGASFAVRIDGAGARAWRFEFERRALLRVEPGGAWAWPTGAEPTRLSIDPVILAAAHATAEAQQAFAGLLSTVTSSRPRRSNYRHHNWRQAANEAPCFSSPQGGGGGRVVGHVADAGQGAVRVSPGKAVRTLALVRALGTRWK